MPCKSVRRPCHTSARAKLFLRITLSFEQLTNERFSRWNAAIRLDPFASDDFPLPIRDEPTYTTKQCRIFALDNLIGCELTLSVRSAFICFQQFGVRSECFKYHLDAVISGPLPRKIDMRLRDDVNRHRPRFVERDRVDRFAWSRSLKLSIVFRVRHCRPLFGMGCHAINAGSCSRPVERKTRTAGLSAVRDVTAYRCAYQLCI